MQDHQGFARRLDAIFNGEKRGKDRETGFVLLVFPFGEKQGKTNYFSNAERAGVTGVLKSALEHFSKKSNQHKE